MPENESIADAVDSYVSSLEKEEEDGEIRENNLKKIKDKDYKDEEITGLTSIAKIVKNVAIGRNGKNMTELEYLINLIGRRKNLIDRKVTIDIKDYRKNRIEKITRTATKMARKAIREGRKIALKPMCSYERKIIHDALSKFKDIKTKSRDEEPYRRIIIYPLKGVK